MRISNLLILPNEKQQLIQTFLNVNNIYDEKSRVSTLTKVQYRHFPIIDIFHTLKDREIPIVFVKMDKYTGAQLSTDITKQNIVPFTESVNEVSLTGHGTHFYHR